VPGRRDAHRDDGIVEVAAPLSLAGYRLPWRAARIADRLVGLRPDLIEAADPYQFGWQAAHAAERLGVPAVAFCHSDLISLATHAAGGFGREAARAYLGRLYARFQIVLAPSRIVAMRLRTAGIEHVRVLPLGVDTELFTPDRRDPQLRTRLGLAPDCRLLVFAGRLAPEKNIGHLRSMLAQLGDPYHLLIIGGDRAGRIERRISMLPYQSDPGEVAALLGAADALVHAGLQETFGLVALEAMACALPVVCYAGGALAEIVPPEAGELAPPGRPAALAEAVAALFASDPATRGRAARTHVVERYRWDSVFERQLQLYGGLLGRRLNRAVRGNWSPLRAAR
jgi:alpha-1,6-mannosyltransferase